MAKLLYIGTTGRTSESPIDVSTAGVMTLPGIANPTLTAGGLGYDTANESLNFRNNNANVTLNIGQENWLRVYNTTGATILNGRAVYISGADAGTGLPTIALARADAAATVSVAGLSTHDIANNTIGYITAFGAVRGIDTSTFSAGPLYLSPTTAGAFTQTLPSAPNYRFRVGSVSVVNASTGVVHVQLGAGSIGVDYANKGDLAVASAANSPTILPVGTNGFALVADSTQTTGLKWAVPPNSFTTGAAGSQTAYGGTASGENLTLQSTTNATKGKIFFGANSAYDQVNDRLGINTTSPGKKLVIKQSANNDGLTIQSPTGTPADFSISTEPTFGGLFWNLITTARLDFVANQMFFSAINGVSFQSNFLVGRQGDSTSVGNQKDSYNQSYEVALWNGTSNFYRYSGVRAVANTAVGQAYKLSFFLGGTDNQLASATEYASLNTLGTHKWGGSPVGFGTNIVNSTVTLADVTNCTFTPVVNILYYFYGIVTYDAAATTTGIRFVITSSGVFSLLSHHTQQTATGTTVTMNEGNTASAQPAAASANSLTTGNIAYVEGFLKMSTAAACTLQFASEVAASAITVKAAMLDFKGII